MKKTILLPVLVIGLTLLAISFARAEVSGDAPPARQDDVAAALDAVEMNSQAVDTAAEVAPPPEEVAVDDALSGKNVSAIDIQGNKSIGVATILAKIKTRVGQEYRQNVISDDLKRLYNTGYFSDVRVDRKEEAAGLKVIIILEEKPIVDEITFSKLKFFNKKVLLSKIKTQSGKFLDKKALNDDVNTIEEMYSKKGLTQVKVEVEQFLDAATNKASLHFIIREGYRVKIKRIKILGNLAYNDDKVIKAMKSRSAWIFNSGFLKEDVLTEDMERVQAFYEKNGYIEAKATYATEQLQHGLVNVDVTVEEGKRFYVGDIQFKGNAVLAEPEIAAVMKDIKKGKIFSKVKLADDVANIKSLYFDRGYIFAKVEESTALNPESGQVDLKLDVQEGGIAYINKINIQGNTQTRDIVIRRELRMYPGDQFDGVKLRRSKERLNNLGYFEDVGFDIEDTDVADQKDLVVDVKEAKTGSFSFGGGYSTVDQLIGFIELDQKNFDFSNWPSFTGGGQRVTARAEVGSSRNNILLSFTEPWMFDYPVSGGFDLYRSQYNRSSSTGYAYDQTRVGGKLRAGKELSEYVSTAGYYRLESVDINNMQDDVSADLKAEQGKSNLSVIGASLANDRRDSTISPTKGWLASGAVDLAGGPVGGSKDFYRLETNGAYYIPLRYNSVVEFSGRLGVVSAYGSTSKVPIFERYFAGGARTIRGYSERAVGPIDTGNGDPIGGEGIMLGSVEYTIPLIDVIKFATFFDSGALSAKYGDILSEKLYSGTGIGFRVKTPIGPMNLDYGIPLNKEPGQASRSSGKFYFSVSRGF
ncbi:MAG: outer membrane protein assembly factor BamA [Candidatus Omnitrophica bacterium]|nr:outer membrane protein assembly factor BamA [Candidatus Omnitrophota bacterium]